MGDGVPGADGETGRWFLLVAGGVLIFWAAHNAFLMPWEHRNIAASVREPALVLAHAVSWMVPVLMYLRHHDPRPAPVALGITRRVNRRGLAWSALGGLVWLALITWLVTETAPSVERPSLLSTLGELEVVCGLIGAVLEELLMRGFLLGQLVRFTTSFRAQACVAVSFGLMHLPAWIAFQGLDIQILPSVILVTLLGAVLGGVAQASNNILPAMALHVANNLLGSWLGAG